MENKRQDQKEKQKNIEIIWSEQEDTKKKIILTVHWVFQCEK